MTVEAFLEDIKSDLEFYDSNGLIDELSIIKWVMKAIKVFGANVTQLQDNFIEIENSKGNLPDNFFQLDRAVKCNRKGYHHDPKYKDHLQESYMWTQTVDRSNKWYSCEPCCSTEEEKVITERVYFREAVVDFYYDCITELCLSRSVKRNVCTSDCLNRHFRGCDYEINIVNDKIYTNFSEGVIYMQYYGYETDDNGLMTIPETTKGEVEEYIEYYVKMKFFERLLANKDSDNIRDLFQYYISKENMQKGLALTASKFETLSPRSFKRLELINRRDLIMQEVI